MAKMFYTKEEVLDKLGKSEDQIKQLIQVGKLREFRDGNKLMFKVDEVDNLAVDDLDLSPADGFGEEGELNLDGTSSGLGLGGDSGSMLGLASETGSQLGLSPVDSGLGRDLGSLKKDMSLESGSVIGLAPGDTADQVSLDDHSNLSKDKDDTVVTTHGEDSFASGQSGSAVVSDPLMSSGAGAAGGTEPDFGDEINLDGGASGSGLLDLSREADDTSLGAELLDEIYPEPSEELNEPKPSRLEVASSTGTETAESELTSGQPVMAAATAGMTVETTRVVRMYDDTSAVFGAALMVPFLMLVYTVLTAVASIMNIQPALVKTIGGKIWYVTGGAGVLTILILVVGMALANRSSQPASPKTKGAKAAKKAKPVPEKKVKKAR